MGKYTLKGSQALDTTIDSHMDLVGKVFKKTPGFRGLVLLGGYGRGEGTPLIVGGKERPFNDYDFICVGDRKGALKQTIAAHKKALEEETGVAVDLFAHTPSTLSRVGPTLFNFEMLYGHRVVQGDQELLLSMPPFALNDIPLVEASYLLLNRGALLLLLDEGASRIRLLNAWAKNALAFGDAVLMALGKYEISYEKKATLVAGMDEVAGLYEWSYYRQEYLKAVEFKMWADPSKYSRQEVLASLEKIKAHFSPLFLWVEAGRLGCGFYEVEGYLKALQSLPLTAKDFFKQMRVLGPKAFSPSLHMSGCDPKARLFGALLLLLEEKLRHPMLPKLLGTNGRPDMAFCNLWRRLG